MLISSLNEFSKVFFSITQNTNYYQIEFFMKLAEITELMADGAVYCPLCCLVPKLCFD